MLHIPCNILMNLYISTQKHIYKPKTNTRNMMQTHNQTETIRFSFINSLEGINLPLLKTEKDGYTLYFLLDTGANKNYIRQDFLNISEINTDTIILDEKEEFYGIDNVCHETRTCNFRFNMGEYEYLEKYHVIENGSALAFPTTDGSLHVAGILDTPFLKTYKAIMDFSTAEIIFKIPGCDELTEKLSA